MTHDKPFPEQKQTDYINSNDLYFRLRTSGLELFIGSVYRNGESLNQIVLCSV